jgi:nicotinate-nucleotide--dimethylbenzimidazole phosphoribosyltransferase
VSAVLRHVIAAISPASAAHAEGVRLRLAGAAMPLLERLGLALGAAQHTAQPRAARRAIVVVAGDHGVGDPGIDLGADHPTVVTAHAIVSGTAALAQLARGAHTPIVLIDAGMREAGRAPASAIALGRGPSADLTAGPAMTIVDAALGLDAGIALAVSLTEPGLDLLAVGAIGVGAEVAAAALLGAATGRAPRGPAVDLDPGALAAGQLGVALHGATGLEQLAALGGPDTAVLAGLMLGAASMNVPILLDGYATGAAALVAAAFAPAVTGYLIAAHAGTLTMPAILAHLGLPPLFEVGLGHGEGAGAAMALALADQVAALLQR